MKHILILFLLAVVGANAASLEEVYVACRANTTTYEIEAICIRNRVEPAISEGCKRVGEASQRFCLDQKVEPKVASACASSTSTYDIERLCLEIRTPPEGSFFCRQNTSMNASEAQCHRDYVAQYKVGAGSSKIDLQSLQENIQLPSQTQIIFRTAYEIEGNEACVAAKNGKRDVKCWICRARKTRNDVRYELTSKSGKGIDQKIVEVQSSQVASEGKEIRFNLAQDANDADNLSAVVCTSESPISIRNRKDLIPIFEDNNLSLVIPAAIVK